MARLYRPNIPLAVRVQVAAGQLKASRPMLAMSVIYGLDDPTLSDGHRLRVLLGHLFGENPYQLDHNPALALRKKRKRGSIMIYSPPANDPAFLIYRDKLAHHIKTNVRGDGAQFSDTVLMKRERRRKKKIARRKPYRWPKGRKIPSRKFQKRRA